MDTKYSQVPLSYLEPYFKSWLATLQKNEVGNIFFIPSSDALFRTLQFSDWVSKNKKIKVEIINIETELLSTPEYLQSRFDKVKPTQQIILQAKNIFTNPLGEAYSQTVNSLYARGIGILIINEGFPSEFSKYISTPSMHQKSWIMPVYPPDVALAYLRNVMKQWHYQLDATTQKTIALYCGGIPWLINDILRSINGENKLSFDQSINTETFLWKVSQFFQSLPQAHQKIFFNPQPNKDIAIQNELFQFGLIDKNGSPLPCIRQWIDKYLQSSLQVTKHQLIINQQNISLYLSPAERRVVDKLWNNKGQVFDRDTIAQTFWEDDWQEKYSDWAIDQIISRLRNKLKKYNVPINIVTKRGIGYVAS